MLGCQTKIRNTVCKSQTVKNKESGDVTNVHLREFVNKYELRLTAKQLDRHMHKLLAAHSQKKKGPSESASVNVDCLSRRFSSPPL